MVTHRSTTLAAALAAALLVAGCGGTSATTSTSAPPSPGAAATAPGTTTAGDTPSAPAATTDGSPGDGASDDVPVIVLEDPDSTLLATLEVDGVTVGLAVGGTSLADGLYPYLVDADGRELDGLGGGSGELLLDGESCNWVKADGVAVTGVVTTAPSATVTVPVGDDELVATAEPVRVGSDEVGAALVPGRLVTTGDARPTADPGGPC